MSKIIFETQDFNLIPNPGLNEFILGVDIDGMIKLKRANDTLVLGVNESAIITYKTVTYGQFINLINTSSLIKGSVYLISDFCTRHYMQYTDTNGDGSSNDEVIYTGLVEPIIVVAISNNKYNPDVKSILYPNDTIIWKHTLNDRERDYVGDGGSRGCIIYRKSENGNVRDYDFRQVKFRRWNNGFGNYTIIRKIDAPNPLDFLDFSSMIESPNLKNFEVGSFNSTYFMDNVILTSTTPFIYNTKIGKGNDSNIGATLGFSTIDYLEGSSIEGNFLNNKIGNIINSTFSSIFNDNESRLINNSYFINANHNRISILDFVNINILNDNQGITYSNLNLNIVENNQISYLNNQLGNTNIIGNKMDIYTGNNLTQDVTYNTIHIFQNNTGTGLINYNQGLEWVGNEFNNNVNGNSINYLINNATMSSISDNFIAIMSSNYGGTYSGNNGIEFNGNTSSIVIDNQLQYFNNNDILISRNNIGYTFNNNNGTSSIISDNIVSEISGNNISENGLFHNNQGTSIVNNTVNSIISNTVTEILGNNNFQINHNIGNLIEDNNGGGTGSINYNNVLVISNTNNFIDIVNNQGNIIILNNVATISSNQVVTIMNNTSDLISENTGTSITGNNNTILDNNQVTRIENNVGDFGSLISKNISNNISSNLSFNLIDNNQVSDISNNINWVNISNNISSSVKDNIINTLIGTTSIVNNTINEIIGNQDIGTISYNQGVKLNNNYFIDDISGNNITNITNNFNIKNLKDNNGNNIIGLTGSTIGAGPYSGSAAFSSTITFIGVDYTPSFNPGDVVVVTGATSGTFSVISDSFSSGNTYLLINQTLNVAGGISVTKVADKLYSLEKVKGTDLKYIQYNNNIIRHTMLDSIEHKSLTPSIPMRFATYSTTSRYLIDLNGHYEERANSTGLTWSGPIA
jgi:hypothetical protein